MDILVTGGTGFLGKALARRLLSDGHSVTIIGRNHDIGETLAKEGITFIKAHLEDETAIEQAIQGKVFVFHCGALSAPWGKYEHFYEANVIGTKNVIKACQKHNVKRLIHVSTPSLYFYFDDRLDVKENIQPTRFVNAYAKTKFLAEQEIDRAFSEGLPVITIRPRALFGPEDTTIIPRLIKANDRRFVPMINGGHVKMDLTYIDNVVDALLLCMEAGDSVLGKKYNITNGETVLFKDVLQAVFKKLKRPLKTKSITYEKAMRMASILEFVSNTILRGKEPVLTKYSVSVLGRNQTLNIDAAKNELGYEPKVSISEGIDRFVEWYEKEEGCP